MKGKTGYLPGLDGWRALAIFAVMMNHDQPWVLLGHTNAKLRGYGGWGVYLFFAISGFLICTRILEEETLVGRFHLKSFYIRRLCRIQPAAVLYLATLAVLMAFGVLHDHWRSWMAALLLYTNFLSRASDGSAAGYFTGHFWTLAVEEHFYILLSLFLFLVKRWRIAVLGTLILVTLGLQRYAAARGLYVFEISSRRTYWIIQFLLLPALLALVLRRTTLRNLAFRFLKPWIAYSATALVMISWGAHDFGLRRAAYPLTHPITTVNTVLYGFTFWVIATTLHPRSWSTRFLEWAPLRYVGRLSYSLYLWHVLFFIPVAPETGVTWPPLLFVAQRPFRYLLAFAAAALSYYLVEKPMIRLGHRLAPPATPGHRDLATSKPSNVADASISAPV